MTLREEVAWANKQLPLNGLVVMHSGNVSAFDREAGVVYIKPSGMDYEKIDAAAVCAVTLDGETVGSGLKPSVDLSHHLFLYRHLPDVGAVVHTHSNYATAFAACGLPIPVVLTAVADEFGGEIPCTPYIDNEGDHIGEAILEYKGVGPAILLGNHGVFAWGATVREALKAAVMVEDVAKTVWLAQCLGSPLTLPDHEVAKWRDRYTNRYGQG